MIRELCISLPRDKVRSFSWTDDRCKRGFDLIEQCSSLLLSKSGKREGGSAGGVDGAGSTTRGNNDKNTVHAEPKTCPCRTMPKNEHRRIKTKSMVVGSRI